MEQPRPLRRRRRSSRRGAGPPGVPATDAPGIEVAAADLALTGIPDAMLPTIGTTTAPVPAETAGPPAALPERTTGEQTASVPTSALANAAFSSPAELDTASTDISGREGAHSFAGSPGTAAATGHPPEHGRPPGEGSRRSYRTAREDQSERSLRALVTTRSTQVASASAMRAREVAVPTAEDLLAAERDLVLVRRHYVPPTGLAAGRRHDRTERRPSGAGQTGNTPSGGSPPTGQPPS